jgi:hypothetical protein
MVKAILEGRKTQTRRVIDKDISNQFDIDSDGTVYAYINRNTGDSFKPAEVAPYHVGDILWVRETWRVSHVGITGGNEWAYIVYKTGEGKTIEIDDKESLYYTTKAKWQPSIHLPRKAARLFLEVTSVRVERLQDISEKDAKAEGVHPCFWFQPFGKPEDESITFDNNQPTHKAAFFNLWDKINAKRGYSWESNPWVWVYKFVG